MMLLRARAKGVWFTTMERGHYGVEATNGEAALADAVDRAARPARDRRGSSSTTSSGPISSPSSGTATRSPKQVKEAGRRLGDLDLLPAPFPIEDLLDERDLRQVKRLYGIGGLSYGNLSARKDERRFWMSASGVDKSKLEIPGRDILLVSGYDEENGRMVLSVPPDVEPRRVSVDAIEHWMIYQAHPGRRRDPPRPRLDARASPPRTSTTRAAPRSSRERRRAARAGARPGARRHRPAKPRNHRDRRQPARDPRPHRAEGPPPDPDVVGGVPPAGVDWNASAYHQVSGPDGGDGGCGARTPAASRRRDSARRGLRDGACAPHISSSGSHEGG